MTRRAVGRCRGFMPAAPVGSYSNSGGSGNRSSLLPVYFDAALPSSNLGSLVVNGSYAVNEANQWFTGQAYQKSIYFDFCEYGLQVITGLKFYGQGSNIGNWDFQVFDPANGWVTLATISPLAAGASTTTAAEYLFSNTIASDLYRLRQTSATDFGTNHTLGEFEFKTRTTQASPCKWSNTGGTGARTGIITATQSGSGWCGGLTAAKLIDGSITYNGWFCGGASGQYADYDFGSAKVINAIRWYQAGYSDMGTWQVAGWDGAAWVDLLPTFAPHSFGFSRPLPFPLINSTAYTKYRLKQIAGTTSSINDMGEVEFRIS